MSPPPATPFPLPASRRKLNAALLAVLFALLIFVPLLLSGCRPERELQVRGQVVEVVARNFSELEFLKIRDREGREYSFETEGFIGFTPSHVKEHQLLGQSLLVTYERRGEVLVAVRLED